MCSSHSRELLLLLYCCYYCYTFYALKFLWFGLSPSPKCNLGCFTSFGLLQITILWISISQLSCFQPYQSPKEDVLTLLLPWAFLCSLARKPEYCCGQTKSEIGGRNQRGGSPKSEATNITLTSLGPGDPINCLWDRWCLTQLLASRVKKKNLWMVSSHERIKS